MAVISFMRALPLNVQMTLTLVVQREVVLPHVYVHFPIPTRAQEMQHYRTHHFNAALVTKVCTDCKILLTEMQNEVVMIMTLLKIFSYLCLCT